MAGHRPGDSWVNGAVAPLPAPFAAGDPDPSNQENCIQFDESIGVFDALCGIATDDYVCEIDGIPADPSTF